MIRRAMALVTALALFSVMVLAASPPADAYGGVVSTVAGPGTPAPTSIARDASGNLYVTDIDTDQVYVIDAAGVATVIAGNGTEGYGGDGGPATSAQLKNPYGVAVTDTGVIYIADTGNHRIRRIGINGTITTTAGTGLPGFSGDGGNANAAQLHTPYGVAVDGDLIYIADTENERIRVIDDGGIDTFAGTGVTGYGGDGGPAGEGSLRRPVSVAPDGAGNIYIADYNNQRVRIVNSSGIINTFAGSHLRGDSGDGGPATSAKLRTPYSVTFDAVGNVYIADAASNRIRVVDSAGIIDAYAGTGDAGFSGDGGLALAAEFDFPTGIVMDGGDNLFIADAGNDRVRHVAFTPFALFCDGEPVTIDMNVNDGDGMGTPNNDVILGTPNDDVIDGLGGNDIVCAGDGDDVVTGGDGWDRLFGQGGDDELHGDDQADYLVGGYGSDEVYGGAQADRIYGDLEVASAVGGEDDLYGDTGSDLIYGGAGGDYIEGGHNNDRLFGQQGADTIDGGPQDDRIYGGQADDVLHGGRDDDRIWGETGHDVIFGTSGNDSWLDGGAHNDKVYGNAGNDVVRGGDGRDKVYGQNGDDDIRAQAGDDLVIDGGAGVDSCQVAPEDTSGGDAAPVNCE